jgi:hypothetical protein
VDPKAEVNRAVSLTGGTKNGALVLSSVGAALIELVCMMPLWLLLGDPSKFKPDEEMLYQLAELSELGLPHCRFSGMHVQLFLLCVVDCALGHGLCSGVVQRDALASEVLGHRLGVMNNIAGEFGVVLERDKPSSSLKCKKE